ncbi:MAG: DUF58 domain-containing protein [Candidatus Zipacnadales bacterium]
MPNPFEETANGAVAMDTASQLRVGKRLALLFGAFFILVVGVLLHIEYLYYMALALAITPGVAYLIGWRTLHGLEAFRETESIANAGERVPMRLRLTNTTTTRKQFLLIRDVVPSGLEAEGPSERFVMELAPGETTEVQYPVLARRRGVYRLGYVDVHSVDPLGLFNYHQEKSAEGLLIVYPRPIPLPRVQPPAAGVIMPQRLRTRRRGTGTDFCGIREYTPGDDLRRIDWKTTAKRGKLSIVEYESGEANNITVALDLSPQFHAGRDDDSTLEYGVTLAASIAAQCLRRGTEFSLIAEGRKSYSLRALVNERDEALVMDVLARVQADCPVPFSEMLLGYETWLPPGSGLVVISPLVGEGALTVARRLIALGHGILWISLIADTFAPSSDRVVASARAYAELASALAALRCSVRQVRKGDDLAMRMGVSVGGA